MNGGESRSLRVHSPRIKQQSPARAADGDCAGGDAGAATLVDGADGVAVEDFVGSVGSREKSTTLINHATTTTAAVTPRPTITPRDDAIVDKATRDDDAG